jgi:crossover junction endodeoxyribonuclease RusA
VTGQSTQSTQSPAAADASAAAGPTPPPAPTGPHAAARGEGATYTLAMPPGYDLLSANDRHDHWAKARIVKQIRKDATTMARACRLPKMTQVCVTAVLHPRDRRHQDSDNVQPTVKACVDAIVAAGLLPGDDERYVLSTTYVLGEPVKGSQLVLHFTPVDGAR